MGVKLTQNVKDKDGKPSEVAIKPEAADLGNFGSPAWMKSVLTDYQAHFAPMKNSKWCQDMDTKKQKIAALKKQIKDLGEEEANAEKVNTLKEEVTSLSKGMENCIDIEDSQMASWMSDYGETLLEEDKDAVDALAEYFYGQAIEADLEFREFPPPSYKKPLAEKGKGLLSDAGCMDCHPGADAEFDPDSPPPPPSLEDYGSAKWLRSFITSPSAHRHYGAKNRMKSKEELDLTDRELELLVKWMTRDYAPTQLTAEQLKILNVHQTPAFGKKEEEVQPASK